MALVEFVVVSSRQLDPKRPERLMKKLKTISKIPVVFYSFGGFCRVHHLEEDVLPVI